MPVPKESVRAPKQTPHEVTKSQGWAESRSLEIFCACFPTPSPTVTVTALTFLSELTQLLSTESEPDRYQPTSRLQNPEGQALGVQSHWEMLQPFQMSWRWLLRRPGR